MQGLTAGKPLSSYSSEWRPLTQKMVAHNSSASMHSAPPPGTVFIPPGNFRFEAQGVEVEPGNGLSVTGNNSAGVDVQFPWEPTPRKAHDHNMTIGGLFGHGLYVDRYPVTCSQYASFLKESGYTPTDRHNWLRNWNHSSSHPVPPEGYAKKPVTYVSLAEARQFCAHHGKRLPQTFEWSYFGQSATAGEEYPWGKDDDPTRYPQLHTGRTIPGPEDVDMYLNGSSKFGVSDLIGNVWQYTSEFHDAHTSAVLLRGGCNYKPVGSGWYFPRAASLTKHGKYFLMSDSYERAGTIGFRCVADVAPQNITS